MTYTSRLGSIVVEVPTTTETPPSWGRWRFTEQGRYLVAPDGQHITQERLEGLLWRDQMELRRAGYASRRRAEKAVRQGAKVKVVIVDLADWQQRYFGQAAG
jgi:hypothetical protein